MQAMRSTRSALIVLGGFAGTGKTSLSERLSSELVIPRLGSDAIGQTIEMSKGVRDRTIDAYWIAYDVLFGLCEHFLESGISMILDLNLGWSFQWQRLDSIIEHHPETLFLPIVLVCSMEICLERIGRRHAGDPAQYDAPQLYTTERKLLEVWQYLERLDRPDVYFVDAARPLDEVYEEIRQYLTIRLKHVG